MKIQDANKLAFNESSYEFNEEDFIFIEEINRRERNIVERHKHKLSEECVVIKFVQIPGYVDLDKFKEDIEIHKTLNNSSYSVKYYGFAIFADHLLFFMESMEMSLFHLYKIVHKLVYKLLPRSYAHITRVRVKSC